MDLFISPEVNDILDVAKQFGVRVASDSIKSVFQKLFKRKPDLFKQKVSLSILELEQHFGKDLFGGNIREQMLKPEALLEYKKWLLPFEEPDTKVLGRVMHFKTLPEDFLAKFRVILHNNLYKDPEFRTQLHDKLLLLSQERNTQASETTLRVVKEHDKEAKKRYRKTKKTLVKTFDNTEQIVVLLRKLRGMRLPRRSEPLSGESTTLTTTTSSARSMKRVSSQS